MAGVGTVGWALALLGSCLAFQAPSLSELGCEQLGAVNLGSRAIVCPELEREAPFRHDLGSANSGIVDLKEVGSPSAVGSTEV